MVGEARGGLALVDYAHKPEALSAALDACRPFATGKLDLRDGLRRGSRQRQAADHGRDRRAQVRPRDRHRRQPTHGAAGADPGGDHGAAFDAGAAHVREIGDRAEAIRTAIAGMGAGDVVLVAGKGHETGQIIGSKVVPFSDHDEIRKALDEVA